MLKVYNPYDQSLIKEIEMHSAEDLEKALDKAHQLFLNRKEWLPAYERKAILERLIPLMERDTDKLCKIAAEEGGKPWQDSMVEVQRAINGVKLAIEHMGQMAGKQIPMGHTASSANRMAFTMPEPIGVVASISAFNHPLNLAVHQIIPAVAVGTPVIFKPGLTTPFSGIALCELLKEAGMPAGWVQCLILENEIAEKLATDARVNYLSFIGSAKVGWYLRSKLAPGTHCALEHGGAAPVIVEKDADIETMLPALLKGGFYHAGQVCVSVQRMYVDESIAEELANLLAMGAKQMKVGDQLDAETEVGPLILPEEVDRVDRWVKNAVDGGAQLLCGGERIGKHCYEPTVLLNPKDDAEVSQHEIFGPVVCVYSCKSREEAIARANSLPYAFQASIFTKDLDAMLESAQALNAAAVMVNDHTAFRVDWMPFGGRDASGMGIGGIPYTMDEMTRDKLMVIKSGKII
jgi:acyl-CoA reductase-like NAD-dependent aldehyde dehydrogenase